MKFLKCFSLSALFFPAFVLAQVNFAHHHGVMAEKARLSHIQFSQANYASPDFASHNDSITTEAERTFYTRSKLADSRRKLQKASDEMFKTDSIKNESIHLKFTYDAAGNNTVTERWFYNFFGNLQTRFHLVREFDGAQMLSETRVNINIENLQETFQNRREYTYTADGILLTEKLLNWSTDEEVFKPQWLISFESDEDGLLTSMTRCNYLDGNEDECVNFNQSVYSYNDLGLETERISSNWDQDEEAWVFNVRLLKTYDDELMLLEQRFAWIGDEWIPTLQTINEYNAAGLLSSSEEQNYNQNNETWIPSNKLSLTYNDLGLEEEFLSQFWSSEWINSFKGTYSYDDVGNAIGVESYFWNNEWIEESSGTLEYDLNVPSENVIEALQNEFFMDFNAENKILQIVFTGNPEEKFSFDEERIYYYSPITTLSVAENKAPGVNLYPNPVSDELFVDFGGVASPAIITMHDLQGRVVLQKQLNKSASLSVGTLSKGVYVYTLQGAGINQSGKVVKVE